MHHGRGGGSIYHRRRTVGKAEGRYASQSGEERMHSRERVYILEGGGEYASGGEEKMNRGGGGGGGAYAS